MRKNSLIVIIVDFNPRRSAKSYPCATQISTFGGVTSLTSTFYHVHILLRSKAFYENTKKGNKETSPLKSLSSNGVESGNRGLDGLRTKG